MTIQDSGTIDSTVATAETEQQPDGKLVLRLGGDWQLGAKFPDVDQVLGGDSDQSSQVVFDTTALGKWDTCIIAFLMKVVRSCESRSVELDQSGLPTGVRKLLALACAVPEKETGKKQKRPGFVVRVGEQTLSAVEGARDMVSFLGDATLSFGRLFTGRARFRGSDVMLSIQECGVEALGIVGLISFLIGLILAFMGAMQLEMFGAEIYVASLVSLGMAREMAPMMTGIIVAGRTGAAYAAQLGTMTVNEEIDSLQTLGFSPMDFLVLPRMLALSLMMPLLTIYSNLMGMLGGFLVGVALLGINPMLYWNQTVSSVGIDDFAIGLVKAALIGVLVAVAGCMRGMQCGRSASAVGLATTSAVVTGIVAIICCEAVLAVVTQVLGI